MRGIRGILGAHRCLRLDHALPVAGVVGGTQCATGGDRVDIQPMWIILAGMLRHQRKRFIRVRAGNDAQREIDLDMFDQGAREMGRFG